MLKRTTTSHSLVQSKALEVWVRKKINHINSMPLWICFMIKLLSEIKICVTASSSISIHFVKNNEHLKYFNQFSKKFSDAYSKHRAIWKHAPLFFSAETFEISKKNKSLTNVFLLFQNAMMTPPLEEEPCWDFVVLKEWPTVVLVGQPQSENQHSVICLWKSVYWVIFLILWHYYYYWY